jgi:hypothetical protein
VFTKSSELYQKSNKTELNFIDLQNNRHPSQHTVGNVHRALGKLSGKASLGINRRIAVTRSWIAATSAKRTPERSRQALAGACGLFSFSQPEEHHERRMFCRRGGNQRRCDRFCDRFLKRPLLTVSRSFMNVANSAMKDGDYFKGQ